MSDLSLLIEAWDEAYREFGIALGDMPDDALWMRPHPRLLSVGELVGHVALAQAIWVLGTGDWKVEFSDLPLESPFLHNGFRYYVHSVEQPVTLQMSAKEALEEARRIYQQARSLASEKNKDDVYSGQWQTWGNLVQYQVFHVAYHTGQIYSVRHLLGHETEDN